MKNTLNYYINLFNGNLPKLQFKAVVQLIDTIELFPVNIYNDGIKQQIQFIHNEKNPHGFQKDFMPIDNTNLIAILQSTGLVDKSDRLIFEGDIVKCKNETFVVSEETLGIISNNSYEYEIIGNAFKNPELLCENI
jgi:uncharacterized phage protein (TIGR01671 family)